MILNGSAVLMTYLFPLADRILSEMIQPTTPNLLKWIFHEHCQIYFVQEWNAKANVSSKGKQYLLFKDNLKFEKYLINVSKLYYSKIIKYSTGNQLLPVETER